MIMICIMGKSGSGKSEIEKQLEKLDLIGLYHIQQEICVKAK